MIRFSSFDVLVYVPDCLTLKWEIENIPAGYTESVNIFRSESPEGPWEPIASDVSAKEYYHDWGAHIDHPHVTVYYKLTGTVSDGGDPEDIKDSEVEHLQYEPDAITKEVLRKENLLLEQYVGFPVLFLVQRTWGPKCVACYDEVLGTGTSSTCEVCYNTKFTGGFYDPIPSYVAFSSAGKAEQTVGPIITGTDMRSFWTTNYPDLKRGDVMIDPQNIRWKIEGVKMQTARLGAKMRQMFSAVKVPPEDVLSKLDVRNIKKLTPTRDYHIWKEINL